MSTNHWGFLLRKIKRKTDVLSKPMFLAHYPPFQNPAGGERQGISHPAVPSDAPQQLCWSTAMPSRKREITLLECYFQSGHWKEWNTQQTRSSWVPSCVFEHLKLHKHPRINWLWAQENKNCLQACPSVMDSRSWRCQALCVAQRIRQLVLLSEWESGNSSWVKLIYTYISVGWWWWLNNCFTLQYVLSYSKTSLGTIFLLLFV